MNLLRKLFSRRSALARVCDLPPGDQINLAMRRSLDLPGTLIPVMGGGALEQRPDLGGVFVATATVDPANMTAVASVSTAVTVTGVLTTDLVVALPPTTIEAGVAVQLAYVNAADSITVITTNASAGAINPASATWTFLVFRR